MYKETGFGFQMAVYLIFEQLGCAYEKNNEKSLR